MIYRRLFVLVFLITMSTWVHASRPRFYYLRVEALYASVDCFINGFPVCSVNADGDMSFHIIPINLALIGQGNTLTLKVAPHSKDASVRGDISQYDPGRWLESKIDHDNLLDFALTPTKTDEHTYVFDNERFDFSHTLRTPPVLQEEELPALKAYGVTLYKWFRKKRIKALQEEMGPKLTDNARACSLPDTDVHKSMARFFSARLFNKHWPPINPDDVVVTPYCEGRIWEISRKDGQALFFHNSEDGQEAVYVKVYVARIGNSFKVVR